MQLCRTAVETFPQVARMQGIVKLVGFLGKQGQTGPSTTPFTRRGGANRHAQWANQHHTGRNTVGVQAKQACLLKG